MKTKIDDIMWEPNDLKTIMSITKNKTIRPSDGDIYYDNKVFIFEGGRGCWMELMIPIYTKSSMRIQKIKNILKCI